MMVSFLVMLVRVQCVCRARLPPPPGAAAAAVERWAERCDGYRPRASFVKDGGQGGSVLFHEIYDDGHEITAYIHQY